MQWPTKILAIGLGGFLGANARYWLGLWIVRWAGLAFPWATLSINVTGAFALGLFATLVERWRPAPPAGAEALTLLLAVGLLGGYTTFSTFALETQRLWTQTTPLRSLAYLLGSPFAGLLAAAIGVSLGRFVFRP